MSRNPEFTETTIIFKGEASWLINQGNYEGALEKLQNCLKTQTKPESRLFILSELGYCYLRLGWFKEAVETFDQYLKGNPSDTDARFYRASAYTSLKWIDEAIKELRIVLASDPKDVLARHDLALCYRDKKGWRKESLNEMKRANAYAMVYGSAEEKRIVASSLVSLEDETNYDDDRFMAGFLISFILLMKMKLRMKSLYK